MPSPSASNPLMDSTASPGTSNDYARGDHVHPTDSTKAAKSDLTSIQATGTTNTTGAAIPAGAYFYLNGILYQAKTQIAVNATFTVNTNCEQVTEGGLNSIRIKVGTKTGTTNSSGLLALDEDATKTIVITARLVGHNNHTLCLIDFYTYQSTTLWIVKAFDGSTMSPLQMRA